MKDLSISYLKGVVEYVLLKVNNFIFLADFMILDIDEDNDVPLILERPFIDTGRALIDVSKKELNLHLNDENHTFSI